MLFERQKRLLALLNALGGDVGNLDFQKLLFLYCLEEEHTPSYEFVPYKFGGFSFTSYADKRRLIENGLLQDKENVWCVTPVGSTVTGTSTPARIRTESFARRHAMLRGDALVAQTYRRYPYYAIRSEIAERVLAHDATALAAIAAARPAANPPGLCSIGYEGRTLEAYLNCLIQNSVTLLCDVRRNPLSRKYGFSKGILSKACGGVGIRYEHMPELGIASEKRQALETQADYDALFLRYECEMLPAQPMALRRIHAWVAQGERVALTCYERLPSQCHRHCVTEALEKQFGIGLSATHF